MTESHFTREQADAAHAVAENWIKMSTDARKMAWAQWNKEHRAGLMLTLLWAFTEFYAADWPNHNEEP